MCFWFVNNLRICTRSLPANMQFQSQSPHCNLSHAQKKIDLYNQTKPSQDDRIPQRAQLELSGPDAEHVSLLRSSLHVTECSSGFLQADIIAPAARDINRPRLICAYEVSYTMRRSSLCHTPLVFRAEPTRVPCLWAHTAPRPLTCCAVFRQSGAEHTEARCQALFPLSPPRVPLYCPWSILSDRLIPINGIIQKTHPLLCLKPCLQFMSSCSYL